MQISGSNLRPVNRLPVEHQQAGNSAFSADHPSLQGSSSTRPVETSLTLRTVVDVREAEALLFRSRFRGNSQLYAQERMDSRHQRALTAYAALQQSAEREYVSAVLGIDEYV